MKLRAPLVAAAGAMVMSLMVPADAGAQGRRVAVPRASVPARPVVVVQPRPTVFIDGYYFPSLYRTTLAFGYGRPYSYGYYGAPYYYQRPYYGYGPYDLSGSIRLQVSPRQAEVFVDGYYAGIVDDFDGIFQRLHVEPGDHEIEVFLTGYRPYRQRIYVQPDRTFSIRHDLEPLGPGEPEAARPTGAPLPPPAPRDPRDPRPAGPERRSPAGESDAAGFGRLSLRVQPADATIVIDGEPWEGAVDDERFVLELGEGVHELEIRKDGYRSYFTDVTIRGGETRTLNVALTPQ